MRGSHGGVGVAIKREGTVRIEFLDGGWLE